MSEVAWCQLVVYAIPDDHLGEYALLVEDFTDDGPDYITPVTPVTLGDVYGNEHRCGYLEDEGVITRLTEWGATFEAWEDPAYGELGCKWVNVATLTPSLWSGPCDGAGTPMIDTTQLPAGYSLIDVDWLSGRDHHAAIAKLRDP